MSLQYTVSVEVEATFDKGSIMLLLKAAQDMGVTFYCSSQNVLSTAFVDTIFDKCDDDLGIIPLRFEDTCLRLLMRAESKNSLLIILDEGALDWKKKFNDVLLQDNARYGSFLLKLVNCFPIKSFYIIGEDNLIETPQQDNIIATSFYFNIAINNNKYAEEIVFNLKEQGYEIGTPQLTDVLYSDIELKRILMNALVERAINKSLYINLQDYFVNLAFFDNSALLKILPPYKYKKTSAQIKLDAQFYMQALFNIFGSLGIAEVAAQFTTIINNMETRP